MPSQTYAPGEPRSRGLFSCPGVIVDPEPYDVVTPTEAARIFGVPAATVRSWIHRKQLQPLGRIGRYNRYDYRDLAEIEAEMRVKPKVA